MTHIWSTMTAAMQNCSKQVADPSTFVWDPTNHFLSRATFGATGADRTFFLRHGPDAWFQAQVRAGRSYVGYSGNPQVQATGPLLTKSPQQLRDIYTSQHNLFSWEAMDQLSRVTLGLQAWSSAQLYEVLVDFFANHLNIPNHDVACWLTRATFDRDVIRPNVFGSFSDMLLASAKHPAMLQYLNLAQSTKAGVNENYGRELLEMHTVGLNYTQSDVTNTARMLTGRTLDDQQRYVFDPSIHAEGPIKVLDWTVPNAHLRWAESNGDHLLRYLAGHRFTAQHLAYKLCLRLVSDTPTADLVNAVAEAYLDNGTAILPMVSTIFRSSEFWESRGQKVRRPAENMIATVRVLGVTAKPDQMEEALFTLSWMSNTMGDRPLDWPAPNGYPDIAAAWRSGGTLLKLWHLQEGFAGDWWSGLDCPTIDELYGTTTPATSGDAIDALTRRVTGMVWSNASRNVLAGVLQEDLSRPLNRSKMQWEARPILALILHSPQHAMR